MSQFFGRFALTAGKRTYVTGLPSDGIGAIVIANDSAFSVVATLEGAGQSLNFVAGEVNIMAIPPHRGFTGNLYLDATAQLAFQNSPLNQVEINVYGIGEATPSNYPAMLPRLSNTGNDVGVQGILRSSSAANINNGSVSFGLANFVPYLKSFTVTVGLGGGAASGDLTISGLDPAFNLNSGVLNYELWCTATDAIAPIHEEFPTPLPGVLSQAIAIAGPSLSTAVIAVSFTFYLN